MTTHPSRLSPEVLAAMAAAGEDVARVEADMRRQGTSPRGLLVGADEVEPFRHYPPGDVYDLASHCQFYFHCHRAGERGHIHLFMRPRGMPPGLVPLASGGTDDAPAHLVAVGLGAGGFASELFTTNRWVTGEAWYAAPAIAAMLPRFQVRGDGANGVVGAWVTALVALYQPLVAALAERRDLALGAWSAAHPSVDPLGDQGLEVTSRAAIDVSAWRKAVNERAAK